MTDKTAPPTVDEDQPKTWKEKIFGKKYKKAHLGIEENKMYYSKELGCWVVPGEEEEIRKKKQEMSAPPPKVASTASMASSADASTASVGMPPSLGSFSIQRSSVSRYATAPGLKSVPSTSDTGGPQASASSVFAGLRPPTGPAFGMGGANTAATMFRPPTAAVFKPAAAMFEKTMDSAPRKAKSPRLGGSTAASPRKGGSAVASPRGIRKPASKSSTPRAGRISAAASPRLHAFAASSATAAQAPAAAPHHTGKGVEESVAKSADQVPGLALRQQQEQQQRDWGGMSSEDVTTAIDAEGGEAPSSAAAWEAMGTAVADAVPAEVAGNGLEQDDGLGVGAIQIEWQAGEQVGYAQFQPQEQGGYEQYGDQYGSHGGEQYSAHAEQYSEQYYGQDGQYSGYGEQVVQATNVAYEGDMQYDMAASTSVVESGHIMDESAADAGYGEESTASGAHDESFHDSSTAQTPSTMHHDSFVQPHPSEAAEFGTQLSGYVDGSPRQQHLTNGDESSAGGDYENSIALLAADPVFREVLGFWAYYRTQCGYDADAMQEWVAQHYYEDYATLDYDALLEHPAISQLAEEHIAANVKTEYGGSYGWPAALVEGGVGAAEVDSTMQQQESEEAASSHPAPPQEGSWEHVHNPEEKATQQPEEIPCQQPASVPPTPGSRRTSGPQGSYPPTPVSAARATPSGSKQPSRAPSQPPSRSLSPKQLPPPPPGASPGSKIGSRAPSTPGSPPQGVMNPLAAAAAELTQEGSAHHAAYLDHAEDPTLGQVFQSFLRPQVAQLAQRVTAAAAAAQQHLHSMAQQGQAAEGAFDHLKKGIDVSPSAQQAEHAQQRGLGQIMALGQSMLNNADVAGAFSELLPGGAARKRKAGKLQKQMPWDLSESHVHAADVENLPAHEVSTPAQPKAAFVEQATGQLQEMQHAQQGGYSHDRSLQQKGDAGAEGSATPAEGLNPAAGLFPGYEGSEASMEELFSPGKVASELGISQVSVARQRFLMGGSDVESLSTDPNERWSDEEDVHPETSRDLSMGSSPTSAKGEGGPTENGHYSEGVEVNGDLRWEPMSAVEQEAEEALGSGRFGRLAYEEDVANAGEGWEDDEIFEPSKMLDTSGPEAAAVPGEGSELQEMAQEEAAPEQAEHGPEAAAPADVGMDGWGGEEIGGAWDEGFPDWTAEQPDARDAEEPARQTQHELSTELTAQVKPPTAHAAEESFEARLEDEAARTPRVLLEELDAAAAPPAGPASSELEHLGSSAAPSVIVGESSSMWQLQHQLDSLTQAYQHQQEELASLRQENAGKDAWIASLQEEKARDLKRWDSQEERMAGDLAQARAAYTALEIERDQLVATLEEKDEAFQSLDEVKKELEDQLRALDAKCDGMAELLAEKTNALEEARSQQEGVVTALQAALDATKEALLQKGGELEDALLQMEMKEEAFRSLQGAAEHAADLDSKLAERNAELEMAEQRIQEAEAALQAAQQDAQERIQGALLDVKTKVQASVEAVLLEKDNELRLLEAQLRQQMVKQTEQAKHDVEAAMSGKDAENERLSVRVKDLEKKFVIAKKKIQMLQQGNQATSAKDVQIHSLTQQLAAAQQQLASVSQEDSALISEHAAEMDSLRQQLAQKVEQLEAQQAAAADALAVVSERDAEIAQLRVQLVKARQEDAVLTVELATEVESLRSQLGEVTQTEGTHVRELAGEVQLLRQQLATQLEVQQQAEADAFTLLSEREAELESLQEQLANAVQADSAHCTEHAAEIEALQTQLAEAAAAAHTRQAVEEEIHVLRQQLQEAQAQLNDAAEQLEEQEAQLEEAAEADAAAAAEKDSQIEALAQQLQEAQQQLSAATEQLQQQEAQLEQAAAADAAYITEKEAQIAALAEQYDEAQQKAAELVAEIESLRQKLEEQQQASADALEVLSERDEGIAALQEELTAAVNAKSALSAERAAEVDALRQQLTEMEGQLDVQQQLAADAMAVLHEREADVAAVREQLAAVTQRDSKESEAELQSLRVQLTAAQEAESSRVAEVASLADELTSLKKSHARTLEDLDAENLKLMDILEAKQEDLETVTVELAELRSRLEAAGYLEGIAEENAKLKNQLMGAQAALRAARGQLDADTSHEAQLANEMDSLRQQLAAALKTDADLTAHSSQFSSELESLQAQLAAAQQHAAESALHAEELEAQAAQQAAELVSVQQQLDAQQQAAADTLAVLSERDEELDLLRAQLAAVSQAEASHSTENSAEVKTLRHQLEQQGAFLAALQENVELLEAAIQERESQLSEMQQLAGTTVARSTELSEAMELLQQQLEQRAEQLEAQQQAAADALAVLSERDEEIAALREQLAAAVQAGPALHSAEDAAELESLRQQLKEAVGKSGADSLALHKELASQSQMVATLQAEMVALNEAAVQREDDLRKFKLQLLKARKLRQQDAERLAALEAEKTALQEALARRGSSTAAATPAATDDEAIAEALAVAEAAEAQLAERTQQAQQLQDQLAAVSSRLQVLEEEVAGLKEANAENEESLADCLTSLGQEEAKVSKLVELLVEHGVDESNLQSVLQQVEEEAGWGDSDAEEDGVEGGNGAENLT